MKLKTLALLIACIILLELSPIMVLRGSPLSYVSATQMIFSPSGRMLFRLNVTLPYEAKVGEDFNIYMQLWQCRETNVSVSLIKVWASGNLTENLVKDQNIQNTKEREILVADRNIRANVPERQQWSIGVWYSVRDLDFKNTLATGGNYLASVHVHTQTYDELTSQVTNLQKQVSDLQTQQWGFIFIAVYLTVTLGIVVPATQKRRKTVSSKATF